MNTSRTPLRPAATLRNVAFDVQQSRDLLINTIRALASFDDGDRPHLPRNNSI